MEVNTLATEIGEIIQDETYGATWIIGKFNEALMMVATVCRIPGLQGVATLSIPVSAKSVPMPVSYLHDLYLVTSSTYPNGVLIAPNLKELTTNSDNEATGPVAMVAVDGRVLNVRPMSEAAEDLVLHFYKKPVELEAGDDFPSYIPEAFQREIFRNFVLREAYLQIEDGVDKNATNTQNYSALFAGGLAAMVAFYPNAPKSRPEIKRIWRDY